MFYIYLTCINPEMRSNNAQSIFWILVTMELSKTFVSILGATLVGPSHPPPPVVIHNHNNATSVWGTRAHMRDLHGMDRIWSYDFECVYYSSIYINFLHIRNHLIIFDPPHEQSTSWSRVHTVCFSFSLVTEGWEPLERAEPLRPCLSMQSWPPFPKPSYRSSLSPENSCDWIKTWCHR